MNMFINLSNHPSSEWNKEQIETASQYGNIVDIPFPVIDEYATETEIKKRAEDYFATILEKGMPQELTVHIMGEQTFCYALISKLQREGIRCVASCTVRDTYVNEIGEKVSSFHFARYREYESSRALRWWIRQKRRINNFIKKLSDKKKAYSRIALALVILAEIIMVIFSQIKCYTLIAWFLLLALLWIFCLLQGLSITTRSTITKLLASAVTPTPLGTLYLLFFVIHIGWLGNAVHGLFSETGDNFIDVLYSTLACIVGLGALVVFFPNGEREKIENPQKVFVSGISLLDTRPESMNQMSYDSLNLLPLVRILQIAEKDDVAPKMVILQTDVFNDQDKYEEVFRRIMELANPGAISLLDECGTINDKLKLLIREVAKREFPELAAKKLPDTKSFIDHIQIEFTEACSYSKNFETAFSVLERSTKSLDDDRHRLYFNLTPGTGIISSLMTLMAIDGDRELYYYSQKSMPENIKTGEEEIRRNFRRELLLPVEKNKIPLQALLSQALDRLETNR